MAVLVGRHTCLLIIIVKVAMSRRINCPTSTACCRIGIVLHSHSNEYMLFNNHILAYRGRFLAVPFAICDIMCINSLASKTAPLVLFKQHLVHHSAICVIAVSHSRCCGITRILTMIVQWVSR